MTRPALELDDQGFDAETEELVTEILLIGRRAIGDATRQLERGFERVTASAIPGDKAWRAWSSNIYPRNVMPAYEPVGEIYGKGGSRTQGMLQWWTEPGTVRPKRGEYLVVPLRAALGTYKGDKITPRHWEGIFKTKLRPFFRAGKTALLIADGVVDARGSFIPAAKGKAMQRGGQKVSNVRTVPIFALIPDQAHGNAVALEPVIEDAYRHLVQTYDRRLARIKV